MITEALVAAQEAHVAAHGPDCGSGRQGYTSGTSDCVAIYRAWVHLSTGQWRERTIEQVRVKAARHDASHGDARREYQNARRSSRRPAQRAWWNANRDRLNERRRDAYRSRKAAA